MPLATRRQIAHGVTKSQFTFWIFQPLLRKRSIISICMALGSAKPIFPYELYDGTNNLDLPHRTVWVPAHRVQRQNENNRLTYARPKRDHRSCPPYYQNACRSSKLDALCVKSESTGVAPAATASVLQYPNKFFDVLGSPKPLILCRLNKHSIANSHKATTGDRIGDQSD